MAAMECASVENYKNLHMRTFNVLVVNPAPPGLGACEQGVTCPASHCISARVHVHARLCPERCQSPSSACSYTYNVSDIAVQRDASKQ